AHLPQERRLLLLEDDEAAALRDQPVLERPALVRRQRRALEPRLQLGDHVADRLHLPEAPVDRRLDVLDRRVLVDDVAERGEGDDRLLDAADRYAHDEVGAAAPGAGAVVDAAYVAAVGAGQPQRALGRRRQARHLQGQLGLVPLRAAGRGRNAAGRAAAGRLLPGSRRIARERLRSRRRLGALGSARAG